MDGVGDGVGDGGVGASVGIGVGNGFGAGKKRRRFLKEASAVDCASSAAVVALVEASFTRSLAAFAFSAVSCVTFADFSVLCISSRASDCARAAAVSSAAFALMAAALLAMVATFAF